MYGPIPARRLSGRAGVHGRGHGPGVRGAKNLQVRMINRQTTTASFIADSDTLNILNYNVSCRGLGIHSNETPRTSALGHLKDHTGFLVSRSLTLPAAPPDEPQVLIDDFTCTQKKNPNNARTLAKDENLTELENALKDISWEILGLSEVRRG